MPTWGRIWFIAFVFGLVWPMMAFLHDMAADEVVDSRMYVRLAMYIIAAVVGAGYIWRMT